MRCGSAYMAAGRLDEAEQSFFLAMRKEQNATYAHYTLASMYVRMNRRHEAKVQFEQAINSAKNPFMKSFQTGLMLIELYPTDRNRMIEAKAHLERAAELQPQSAQVRQILDELNRALSSEVAPDA